MNKIISQDQVQMLINTFYQTNITAKDFDLVKEFLSKLPDEKTEEETWKK